MFVTDQDPFAGAAHAMLFVVLFEALQAREHRRVFFRLVLFGAEGVVAEGVEADGFGLVGGEGFGEDGPGRGLVWGVGREGGREGEVEWGKEQEI